MPALPVFTSGMIQVIKDLIVQDRQRVRSTTNRPSAIENDHQAPEVYVALTPPGGIPALVPGPPDMPGQADCDVYELQPNADLSVYALINTYLFTVLVNNLSLAAVPGSTWIVTWRDKHGDWWTLAGGGGGGGGSCACPPVVGCTPQWVQYEVDEVTDPEPVVVLFSVPAGTIVSAIRVNVNSTFADGTLDVGYTDNITAWSALTTYNPGDQVSSGGNNYVCILTNLNQIPPNATYWTLTGPGANNPTAFLAAFDLTTIGWTYVNITVPNVVPSFTESVDIICTIHS